MKTDSTHFDLTTCFKLLCLTLIATFSLDHSQLDVFINQFFYVNGHWLLTKGTQPLAFIFYDAPKYMLILFTLYLLVTFVRSLAPTSAPIRLARFTLSRRETGYLIAAFILIPASISLLKATTHVSCPSNLILFGGNQPYLDIWHSFLSGSDSKCFPAAHASTGFALYALAFLPCLYQHRYLVIKIVTAIGWTLGLYKMLIGDHFFSHTLVSMLLSLTISYTLAYFIFTKSAVKIEHVSCIPYQKPIKERQS